MFDNSLSFERPHGLTGQELSSSDVQRWFTNASQMEPMVDVGDGKTHRFLDSNDKQLLQYFLVAAANSSEAFRKLAKRLSAFKTQNLQTSQAMNPQPAIYDLALMAQELSGLQRDGGRVNEGIIAMILPVVAGQALYLDEKPNPNNIDKSFELITKVMSNTNVSDVRHLHEMVHCAARKSDFTPDALPDDAHNVFEFYKRRQGTELLFHDFSQYVRNFPVAHQIVKEVIEYGPNGPRIPRTMSFIEMMTLACTTVRKTLSPTYPVGQFADDTALALYILFSHFPDTTIVTGNINRHLKIRH